MTIRIIEDAKKGTFAAYSHHDKKLTKDHKTKADCVKELVESKTLRPEYARTLADTGMVEQG